MKEQFENMFVEMQESNRDYQSIAITVGTQMCLEDSEKMLKKIFISCLCQKIKRTENDQ